MSKDWNGVTAHVRGDGPQTYPIVRRDSGLFFIQVCCDCGAAHGFTVDPERCTVTVSVVESPEADEIRAQSLREDPGLYPLRAAPTVGQTASSPEPRHSPYCESVLRPPRMCDCAASGPPVVEPQPASEDGLIEDHEYHEAQDTGAGEYGEREFTLGWCECGQPRSRHRPRPPESEEG